MSEDILLTEVNMAASILGIEIDGLRCRARKLGFSSKRIGQKYFYNQIQMRALRLFIEIRRKDKFEVFESKMNFEDI